MPSARTCLHVDATQGASGDMILGALVDLGVPAEKIRRAVRSLPIDGWTLRSRRIVRCSLAARKIDVRTRDAAGGRNWRELSRILRAGDLEPAVKRAVAENLDLAASDTIRLVGDFSIIS